MFLNTQYNNRLKDLIQMKKLFPFILGAAFGLTIFFFSPADIFLANQQDFVINTARMLIPLGLTAAAAAAVISAVLILLRRFSRRAYAVLSCLILGFLGASYFQMMFFNGRMNILDGSENNYSSFDLYNTADFVLWFLIFILPTILWAAREQYKKNKFLSMLDSAKAAYLCGAVIFMQAAGTSSLALTNGTSSNSSDIRLPLFSYSPASQVSSERNITVFLMDMLSSTRMDELLESYPEMTEKLDGFTFYRDNVSEQCFTFPSVTQMLTQKEYDGSENIEYFESAWSGDSVPKILHENGWKVYLFADKGTTYSDVSQIMPFSDNTENYSYSVNYLGAGGICRTMISLSLFKCLPYRYKVFFETKYSDISNGFFRFSDEENEKSVLPYRMGIDTDIKYYRYLTENGLSADSGAPTFSFIHLNAAHDKSEELSALYGGYDGNAGKTSTARGSFECVFAYIDELKRLGIYDNTVIILLADHGDIPEYIDGRAVSSPDTAVLLIKPAGQRGDLITDDTAQLSNKNFAPSVLEYAGLEHSQAGSSYSDIINSGGKQERFFNGTNYYNYDSEFAGSFDRFTYFIKYRINGNSRDFENWELISRDAGSNR